MKQIIISFILLLIGSLNCNASTIETITFNDPIGYQQNNVYHYKSFTFENGYLVDKNINLNDNHTPDYQPNYYNSVISDNKGLVISDGYDPDYIDPDNPDNHYRPDLYYNYNDIGYQLLIITSTRLFNLQSCYFTSAFHNEITLYVWDGHTSKILELSTNPLYVEFEEFNNLNSIQFITVDNDFNNYVDGHVVIDNLIVSYNNVPLPSSIVLLLSGLSFLMIKRKEK